PWRAITPVKPCPLLKPRTSTASFGENMEARTVSPTLASPVRGNSLRMRVGGTLAFSKWPRRGLLTPLRPAGSTSPTWAASTPSRSLVRSCTTMHGPAASTVTGTTDPSASKTWVIPTFLAMRPSIIFFSVPVRRPSLAERLDLHVHAGRQVELHQGVDRLRGRLQDVEEPFVRADLELLARFLVHVRGAQHPE